MSETWFEKMKADVASDKKYHLGHFFKDCMLKDPDVVCQIDAATGEEETRRSVLMRSITLAKCLRALDLKPGDVLAIGGYNHLDIHIPYYAALLNGYPISGVDPSFKYDEIKHLFKQVKPKIAFCQRSFYNDYWSVAEELGLNTRVVTFDGDDNTMGKLMQQCDVTDNDVDEFQVAEFDTDKIYAWLISTSGTTGFPKVAAIKHHPIISLIRLITLHPSKTLQPALNLSAVQWVSAFFNAICWAALNHIKVQTSAPATAEHVIDIINKYRPVAVFTAPSTVYRILRHQKPCDWSCFNYVFVIGACVHKSILVDLRAVLRPDAGASAIYGLTESVGLVLQPVPDGPLGNCGIESPIAKVKLVDPVTEEIITEPNVPGELWMKGLSFTEYYNNPEETAKAFSPDGWYKTGDLLKRDENGFFFFVERQKLLIKFRSYHVVPLELEEVILTHEGIQDACVTSVANLEDGEWPVAVVVKKPGALVSAHEIQELVASKLSEHKQLRGGVVFVDEIPMTSTGKIARAKVKKLVENAKLKLQLKDPDVVCQIDAATGEEETRRSVLKRSITLAKCLRALDLKPGDVLAIGGYNHLDIHIPYYAAMLNGYPISGVDPSFKYDEIKHLFKQVKPKIAFCQRSFYNDYWSVAEELGLNTRVVTFDGDDNTMGKLMQQCDVTDNDVDEFQVAEFDTDKIYAWLISTSGTTGFPKVAAIKHHPIISVIRLITLHPSKTLQPALNLSAVHWVSAFFNAICMPAMNQIKVQTSAPATAEHVIDIINKYRPVAVLTAPSTVYRILRHQKPCDWSCFNYVFVIGAYVHKSILVDLRAVLRPDAGASAIYGLTESVGLVLQPVPDGPLGNCGIESPIAKVKLVDPVTEEIITEPNVPGELWMKGLSFTEYYNNPEETAKAFSPDGWYKTGDLLKRDENGFFFFVERQKLLIKFRSYHVVPLELEEIILRHEGIQDACVTSVANLEDGEWPVAVVVRKPGALVSAHEIQELVASKLSEHKQLRGGVVFVDEIPMTSTGKIARAKVKKLVENAKLK